MNGVLLSSRGGAVAITVFASLFVQACSTVSGGSGVVRSTAMDRAIGGCIGSVAVGAVSGAIIGAAIGGRSGLERGALVGAAAGVGRCAVLVQLAAAEDKAKLREAELAAISSNRSGTRTITTKSGKSAKVRTTVTAAPLPEAPKKRVAAKPAAPANTAPNTDSGSNVVVAGDQVEVADAQLASPAESAFVANASDFTECRFSQLFVEMEGQSAEADKQKWCKSGDGTWEPVAA